MKDLLILVLINLIVRINAFNCVTSKNMSINPMDYRSYYMCANRCPSLKYCQPPRVYFSEESGSCIPEPDNWIPRYYLSGTVQPNRRILSIQYVRQDGYEVIWTYDDPWKSETFTGRYVNEIKIQGILLRRVLATNCINVFNVEMNATADRSFCAVQYFHPQSALCDFSSLSQSFNYCQTLTI